MKVYTRGNTLAETIISLFLLNLLMAFMFFVYRLGATALQSGEADTQLTQSAQLVTTRMSREASRSSFESLALDPPSGPATAVSFLSPVGANSGSPSYDPNTLFPIWHSHFVCYHVEGAQELRWKMIPVSSPSINIERLTNLELQRSQGALLSEEITSCEFTVVDKTLEVNLLAARQRLGKNEPDTIQLRSTVFFRN